MTKHQPNTAAANADDLASDLLWGAQAIGDYAGLDLRRAHYLIQTGVIPVKRLGHRKLVATKAAVRRALTADEEAGR
jgi:hypothetical protein